jgi:hypothetical protein
LKDFILQQISFIAENDTVLPKASFNLYQTPGKLCNQQFLYDFHLAPEDDSRGNGNAGRKCEHLIIQCHKITLDGGNKSVL